MKTALIYSSKYGSTKRVANQIAEKLKVIDDLFCMEKDSPDLHNYDAIILGMPIYAGSTTRDMRSFLKKNRDSLKDKIIAVFILCWDSKRLNEFVENIFPEKLPENVVVESVGGELDPELLMDVEKAIIYDLTGITEKTSDISDEKIDMFVEKVNSITGS